MQATQSAVGSRNRSLLMTLIMIVGALSPIMATAASGGNQLPTDGTEGQDHASADCSGDFSEYNDSVWINCIPGEWHIKWSLEDLRYIDFYGAYNEPVPDGMHHIATL